MTDSRFAHSPDPLERALGEVVRQIPGGPRYIGNGSEDLPFVLDPDDYAALRDSRDDGRRNPGQNV
jgi:hypothetical protein